MRVDIKIGQNNNRAPVKGNGQASIIGKYGGTTATASILGAGNTLTVFPSIDIPE